ncbi:antitoxin Xre-like helix-turn-helix domain-containing protein [Pelagerythrobacter aerophilus]|uniref:DUF2384 domain-containing protein n=1 Tax=Pelagerythrobacter aerophilus TaxID=2306995 RepID=A0A418NKJ7_9SPHN|nr:antitoxin Xre-like helix-turn-helix domain-containing protein [Pelagerythrobacter aerophilus]RIV79945.1 DUF2384 domain-containing protein [Pelagerythrobacter aerophilus]
MSKQAPPQVDAERFAPANRRRLSGPGLRTFLNIAEFWSLSEDQQRQVLGGPASSTYRRWCKKAREHGDLILSADVLTRISAVLGIYAALRVLFAEEDERIRWLAQPHIAPVFGGLPPMNLVTRGALGELLTLRRFLDAARGGIYMAPNAIDVGFEPYSDGEIIIG